MPQLARKSSDDQGRRRQARERRAANRTPGCTDSAALAAAKQLSRMTNPSDIVMMDALALSRAIQSKQVSCVEVMNAYLDHIDALNPKVNAIVSLQDRGDLVAQAKARDERACARRDSRLDARPAAGDQGPDRDQGHPHHARLAHLQGFRADRRRHPCRARQARRRHHHRQDQHAGVRARLQHLQRRVRPHAQRLRPVARPPADRAAAPASRSRCTCCRSPTAPITAARCAIRPPTTMCSAFARRSAACRRKALDVFYAIMGDAGPDGAQRARSRDAAVGAGRLRSARAAVEPAGPGAIRRAAQARFQGHAHRLGRRLRRPSAVRAGHARSLQGGAEGVRIARLHGRGGHARLSDRAGLAELENPARLAVRLGAEGATTTIRPSAR